MIWRLLSEQDHDPYDIEGTEVRELHRVPWAHLLIWSTVKLQNPLQDLLRYNQDWMGCLVEDHPHSETCGDNMGTHPKVCGTRGE